MSGTIQRLGAVGICLALYALHVEHEAKRSSENGLKYQALCDISSIGASCTAVFTSEWGRLMSKLGIVPKDGLLDLPNAAYGAAYYLLVMLYPYVPLGRPLLLLGTLVSFATTATLAYALAFILGDVCVVCISTYFINTALLVLVLRGALAGGKKAKHA
ncbi:vitamin K epoxide reductase [Pavlovales sp. CCMP2436]|nr:vitamin K epoxide reductase [Pavlovales sp. CCMP2436]|mmetsp:Transcript_14203/g.33715  ORF Transcript_14203/g.33715 Transcript_14203/m.33715 type:complete len:159 (+) Transcript_14203:61-537(+)